MSFIQYNELVEEGSTVVVYLNISNIYALTINCGKVFQTKYGALRHDDVIGKPYGSIIQCTRGWVYVLFPTPELWTLALPHRTQILYTPDISLVLLQLDLKPGCVVFEAGTGSGSLSHAIARTVAPYGHLYTFDFHEQRVVLAAEEFKAHGLSSIVTVAQRDVCKEGFGQNSVADAVFLDIPHPWEAIPFTLQIFKAIGGRFCSFSPCIEQVQKTCSVLHSCGFADISTVECVIRPFEVKSVSQPLIETSVQTKVKRNVSEETGNESVCEDKSSTAALNVIHKKQKHLRCSKEESKIENFWTALPALQMAGHTGYLTFASLNHYNINGLNS